ncbi:TonB family protein [Pelobium sp.]|nr:TonB family protein [Pelobium sp.]MDA9554705.1 TonB family protein [Pelobium sp.]
MNWANYLIQINIYLTLFYGFYVLVLRNETFFNLNRAYLLGASLFALLIPLYQTEWVQSFFITEKAQTSWNDINIFMVQGFATPIAEDTHWTLGDYFTLIYFVGIAVLVFRLVYKLWLVGKMFNSVNHPEAFSFFSKIFVNDQLPQKEQIKKHEQTHAKQFHSADVIFLELLSIINWFNPIIYLYKKSIRHIHEFIADEEALHLQNNKKDYALLLFSKSFGVNPNSLTNNFFNQSLLKRRIQMLQKPKSRKTAILKYGLSAPLFLLAMILSSATISKSNVVKVLERKVKPTQAINAKIETVVENISKINETINPETGVDTPKVETLAAFPGGTQAFNKFIATNLNYPKDAKDKKIQGKVVLSLVVKKDGSLTDINVLKGIGGGCDEEAIRVLKLSQNWYPAIHNTKAIDSKLTLPIDFRLDNTASNTDGTADVMVVNGDKPIEQDNAVFSNVEVLPTFPGGVEAFRKFLNENLRYPAQARENNISGIVYLTFIVEKDGGLSNIKIVRGIGAGCDEEAVRVLSLSPKWNPGVQNGKIVRVSYTVPIFFQMTGTVSKEVKKELSPEVKKEFDEKVKIVMSKNSLYIVDGKEIPRDAEGNRQSIPPTNIEKAEVLKGEDAIKIYGEKGKNGVVRITTKKSNGDSNPKPLLYLNGSEISYLEMSLIDKSSIESMNVLKGEQAIKKYGEKGKDGVIEITTKKKN